MNIFSRTPGTDLLQVTHDFLAETIDVGVNGAIACVGIPLAGTIGLVYGFFHNLGLYGLYMMGNEQSKKDLEYEKYIFRELFPELIKFKHSNAEFGEIGLIDKTTPLSIVPFCTDLGMAMKSPLQFITYNLLAAARNVICYTINQAYNIPKGVRGLLSVFTYPLVNLWDKKQSKSKPISDAPRQSIRKTEDQDAGDISKKNVDTYLAENNKKLDLTERSQGMTIMADRHSSGSLPDSEHVPDSSNTTTPNISSSKRNPNSSWG